MLVTKKDIEYSMHWAGHTVIPAGTPVIEATNLPREDGEPPRYWAEIWPEAGETEQSWQRNYGFLLDHTEVLDVRHLRQKT